MKDKGRKGRDTGRVREEEEEQVVVEFGESEGRRKEEGGGGGQIGTGKREEEM